MPRTNVWLNEDQVKRLHRQLGKGVSISGCIRAGLTLLLDALAEPNSRDRKHMAALLAELDGLVERAESQLTPAAQRRVKRAAKS